LDVQEIRHAFLSSESIVRRIRDFRLDRVAKVGVGDTPVAMNDYPKIVLHYIPLSAFETSQELDLANIPHKYYNQPQISNYTSHRFNLDGVLFYKQLREHKPYEYIQVSRNGNFEYVNGEIITPWQNNGKEVIDLPSPDFEIELVNQTDSILSFQKMVGIEPPIYLFMSFVGVKGLRIGTRRRIMAAYHNLVIDRDVLLIPEVSFKNYPSEIGEISRQLKPAFDAVWNSAGWPRSINYTEDGTWHPSP